MSRSRALASISISIVLFIAVNSLVTLPSFKSAYYGLNPVSYFYIGYDWRIKNSRVVTQNGKGGVGFFGTSQTVFSIDPNEFDQPVTNYGLFAASQNEINDLLETAVKTRHRFDKVVLEVNAMALSKRLMQRNHQVQRKGYLKNSDLEFIFPVKSILTLHIPLVKYSEILLHTLKKAFASVSGRAKKGPLADQKHAFHQSLFRQLDVNILNGYLPVERIDDSQLKSRLNQDCKVMVEWNILGGIDSQKSFSALNRSIKLAKQISQKVVLWLPPVTSEWSSVLPETFIGEVEQVARSSQLEIIDQSQLLKNSTGRFFDCAHVGRGAAKPIAIDLTRRLFL